MGAGAQEVVGPDGPDSPSTGNKTITVIQAAGGTISPAGDASGKVSVKGGTDQAFTVTATKGFEIGSLSVDGVSVDAALVAGKSAYVYTFVGLSADHTLTATFTANRFDLSASAGKGGSIVPAVVQVVKGGSQTFTITPDAGYEIADITVDDVSKGNTSSFILTDIEAPHSIFATFKGIDCRVTWGDIENGSLIVTAEPDQTVAVVHRLHHGAAQQAFPKLYDGPRPALLARADQRFPYIIFPALKKQDLNLGPRILLDAKKPGRYYLCIVNHQTVPRP